MARFIVGVMGAGENASPQALIWGRELGRLIAEAGWALLTGGRNCGVMAAANQGAKEIPQSLTLGILPHPGAEPSPDVDLVIVTDLGNGRNNINVLTSQVVVACGVGGAGTVSEIALALKCGKPVILLGWPPQALEFWRQFAPVDSAETPLEAVGLIRRLRPNSGA
ncbi:MAG: cytochrome [Cyanobacteria bacterium RI_101]|jgi:uncharacterized protein (TIGR00725 family)|nr:cytochrome [Cyanobacteria bacterium RI_101]